MPIVSRSLLALFFPSMLMVTPAFAAPPPPRIDVIAYSTDLGEEGLAEAYVTLAAYSGAFERAAPGTDRSKVRACAASNSEACIRALLTARGGAAVIIVVQGAGVGIQKWTCFGSGGTPVDAAKQTATINLQVAFFGERQAKFQQSQFATACIMSAAAESGW